MTMPLDIRNIVVLTGAGVSAESGLATFRGPDGLWEGHRVEDVATPQAFQRDPGLVHQFYDARRAKLGTVEPNAAHQALARLDAEWAGELLLVTQNVDDLHERGLLDTTLVVCLGEFGRTPKINHRAARDHWPQCYFSLWAGGGIEPGRVIGRSDAKGERPVTRPIDPVSVGTTIMDLAGVNSAARAKLGVLRGGEAIHELL